MDLKGRQGSRVGLGTSWGQNKHRARVSPDQIRHCNLAITSCLCVCMLLTIGTLWLLHWVNMVWPHNSKRKWRKNYCKFLFLLRLIWVFNRLFPNLHTYVREHHGQCTVRRNESYMKVHMVVKLIPNTVISFSGCQYKCCRLNSSKSCKITVCRSNKGCIF